MVPSMTETDLDVGDHRLRLRDAGDPYGSPVLYFHSTPGSRLDMAFADDAAAELGVRIVSFDRPGCGHSTAAHFGLASIARDAAAIADALSIDRFATLGQSGGGPFALAAAGVLGTRVTRVGVASGPGPFDLVPGALGALDDNDRTARALLPDDPVAAAQGFARGFEPLASTFREASPTQIAAGFEAMLSTHDRLLMRDHRLASGFGQTMKESLRQGSSCAGWDNVAWVGPWEVDPTTISCPVLLWYGDDDKLCPPAHGVWLRDNLPNAELMLRSGEGHLGFVEHTAEMLTALTAPSP
jgi:pimeloyl-ACP methyl ester carboxylesterase